MTPSEFHASRKFVDTPFGRIAYVERGTGLAALFLHGLPLCGYEWRSVIETLAPERRCIALDMMGLGYTETESRDLSFAAQAAMVAAFLDALAIDRIDLVGNDTGAGVSQLFAVSHPERLRTLTLTNCEVYDLWPNALLTGFYAGVVAGVVPQGMKQMLADNELARSQLGALVYEDAALMFPPEAVEVYLAPIVASERRVAELQKLADWETNRAQIVAAAPKLRASKVPTRVLWGDGDVVFDTQPSLDWLRANLGGLRKLTIVPRGMLFFPEEHPRLASVLIREFWETEGREA